MYERNTKSTNGFRQRTGIILAIIYLLVVSKFISKKISKEKFKKVFAIIHKILGITLIVFSIFHMILVWPLMEQRPFSMFILGFIMIFLGLIEWFSYIFRKKLKKNCIVIHRVVAAMLLICILTHVIIGITSMNTYLMRIQDIQVENVDLSNVKPGVYIGDYDAGYIYAKVKVTVKDNKIVSVDLLEHRNERGIKAEVITEDMVKYQKVKVDAVTTATNSSKVIMKAVENALEE